jgi:hypothetical protein
MERTPPEDSFIREELFHPRSGLGSRGLEEFRITFMMLDLALLVDLTLLVNSWGGHDGTRM